MVKRVLPVAVVYETLLASPKVAAATALQKSTSKPFQLPLSSGAAKPGKPVLIIQFNLPLALTSSNVLARTDPANITPAVATAKIIFVFILNLHLLYNFHVNHEIR